MNSWRVRWGRGWRRRVGARWVDATFADILAGRHSGRTSADQLLLSTPFSMAILEIALAAEVLPVSGSWAWNARWRIMPPL